MANPQDRPSKRCRCGKERAFTDNKPGCFRDNGEFIGPACAAELVIQRSIEAVMGKDSG